ncbi:MAG TPA: hypothetical protein VKF61_03730 [Candidatus Polarisedimenticolia bacterium]|nr:hypothetical protein [Candidatus Polarisedimenticolia bacterium]
MRRILWAPAFLIWALLGCGSKESDRGTTVTPPSPVPSSLACSSSLPQIDDVVMTCRTHFAADDSWQIDVVIGSPTTSTDIGGFAFDILFDPTVLTYVPGSAGWGEMLVQDGITPLFSAETVPGDPGRLVVGIYRPGGQPGVQGTTTYNRIMVFRVKAVPGVQFDQYPPRLTFDMTRSEAIDSSPSAQAITSIKFRDQILLSKQ